MSSETMSLISKCVIFTFSSRALWCSKSDLRALRTSTSDETPAGDCACLFTTVILRDRSWRDTRHSRCSRRSWNKVTIHQCHTQKSIYNIKIYILVVYFGYCCNNNKIKTTTCERKNIGRLNTLELLHK